jgi:hypothetical protein
MKTYYGNFLLASSELLNLVIVDGLLSIISAVFVFVYLSIHLESKFLALIGILIILFSYPTTVMITEGILRV